MISISRNYRLELSVQKLMRQISDSRKNFNTEKINFVPQYAKADWIKFGKKRSVML